MNDFIIAFVGLPSSGKSSIINSLVLKRLLQSGVCRTTTEFKQIEQEITDDNNNKFKVIDLPGICDSEENNINFNDLTYAHITNSNLIIWTSDVNKTFITTHEVDEYNKLKNYIKNIGEKTGTLYHIIIMLSKCDKEINDKKIKKNNIKYTKEIDNFDEDTDINDLIIKVKEKFPNEDIILYNAFGRSYHHNNTSTTLKLFIKNMIGEPTKNNITFDISKYIKTYRKDQQEIYYNKFLNMYDNFINNKINDIMIYWNKITKTEQLNHLLEVCNESNINYNIFKYINNVCDEFIEDNEIIRYKLIDYYFNIIKNSYYYLCYNKFKNFNIDNLIELFIEHFIHLSENKKKEIYQLLLFTDKIPNNDIAVKIINKIYEYSYDEIKLSFYNTFNEYIIKYNRDEFNIFYYKMKLLLEKDNYTIIISNNIDLYDRFNQYIDKLRELNNNEDFILFNKLQIIHCLLNKTSITSIFHNFLKYNIGIPYDRLKYNNKYIEAINNIWNSIYSNIKINFNHNNFNDFIPIDKTELLYLL